jgi:hypothetical protein
MLKPTKQEREAGQRDRAEQAAFEARMLSANRAYHRKFPNRQEVVERALPRFSGWEEVTLFRDETPEGRGMGSGWYVLRSKDGMNVWKR